MKDLVQNEELIYKIQKLYEAYNLLNEIHTKLTNHRGLDVMIENLKSLKIFWKVIYDDIRYYIKNCPQCQCKNKTIFKRPKNK